MPTEQVYTGFTNFRHKFQQHLLDFFTTEPVTKPLFYGDRNQSGHVLLFLVSLDEGIGFVIGNMKRQLVGNFYKFKSNGNDDSGREFQITDSRLDLKTKRSEEKEHLIKSGSPLSRG